MATQTPDEAVVRFADLLERTTRCITPVPLKIQPPVHPSDIYHIIFHGGGPVELRTERGSPALMFSLVHHCKPLLHASDAAVFTVSSAYYAYDILDLEEQEILLYHWHPAGVSPVTDPHLHLSSRILPITVASRGRSPQRVSLADMHIRTGRVLLEDVVRVLIDEFKVMPLRRDWQDVLARNRQAFHSDRSW